MQSEDIYIENLTIDIFLDDRKDANSFLNKSVDEIKQWVLPELEKRLLELNIRLPEAGQTSTLDLDLNSIELDLVASKETWKEDLSTTLFERIAEEVQAEIKKDTLQTRTPENKGIRAESADDRSTSSTSFLIDLYLELLKTGIVPSRKTSAGIRSYLDLEAKIQELEIGTVWTRLIPIFQSNRNALLRFARQSSQSMWNNAVNAQFSQEVQQFIGEWLNIDPSRSELIKTTLVRMIVERPAHSNAHSDFTKWKDDLIASIKEPSSLLAILDSVPNNSKSARFILEQTREVFQRQYASLSKALLEHRNALQADEPNIDADYQKISDLITDEIIVENAGIVLLQPFFPSVFKNLGFLNEKNQWIDEEAQVLAIYTLYYIATGEWEASEDQVLIEKILTGFPLENVLPLVEKKDILTEALAAQMEELLEVIHDNWKPMRNCTWTGLRNDFLTRSAQLEKMDEMNYKLILEPHMLDVLLPLKNWGMSLVKYSWMEGMVFVEWG